MFWMQPMNQIAYDEYHKVMTLIENIVTATGQGFP